MRDRSFLTGSVAVIVAATGFGMLGVLARTAYDAGFEPFSFVAWRALFGTAVVAAFVAWRLRRGATRIRLSRLPRSQQVALGITALTGLGLNLAMFFAFDLTTVALVLLGFYTYPAMIAAVAAIRGQEPLDGTRLAALGLATVGMLLVVVGGLDPAGGIVLHPLGLALAVAAAICQTIFVVVSRNGFASVPVDQAMAWILAFTAVSAAVAALVAGQGASLGVPLGAPDALALAVFTGVVAAGIPSTLFLVGIRLIGGTRAGILMLLEPVVGVVLAAALLQELLLPIQVAGGMAVLGAALLLQRSGGAPAETDAAAAVGTT